MGYGGGKTCFGCAELLQFAMDNPGAALLDVSPSYKQAKKTTVVTYAQMISASNLPVKCNKTDHEYQFANGSVIWIASGDNPDSLKGPNITHARIDEPFIQDYAVYEQVIARLRLENGPLGLVLTGTPEGLSSWGYELLFGDKSDMKGITRAIIQRSSMENTSLPPSYIQNMLANYDEQTVQAYVYGKFVSLNTLQAYYGFNASVHASRPLKYDPARRIFFTLDFNVQPMCSLIIQQDGEVDHVIDEIVIKTNGTTERICDELLQKYGRHAAGITITGDPAGVARNVQSTVGGFNNFAIMRSRLGHMPGFYDGHPTGIVPIINSLNLANGRFMNSKGEARIFIDPKCKTLIKDLERVKRNPKDGTIDKSDENLTHSSDGFRYYLHQFRRPSGYAIAA